jgi:hypothetical protein
MGRLIARALRAMGWAVLVRAWAARVTRAFGPNMKKTKFYFIFFRRNFYMNSMNI